MKRTKERMDERFGTWKPVKLTRAQRLDIYRKLKAGAATSDWAGLIPFPQLEDIYREFEPGAPHNKPDNRLRGIMGNKWYCEAGCGAVMKEKKDGQYFISPPRSKGQLYLCDACYEAAKQRQLQTSAPALGSRYALLAALPSPIGDIGLKESLWSGGRSRGRNGAA